jgi:alpha-beta hydrolase superfamily lysophospholipase
MNPLKKIVSYLAIGAAGLITLLLGVALLLVFWPAPKILEPKDVYGFKKLSQTARATNEAIRPPQYYRARDGAQLAYRFYDSKANRILIFVHGSSYHGGGYDDLAQAISAGGFAKVYLPNLRGHYLSGPRSGDVEYIGQLEDDIADLIGFARARGQNGPLILGGHSSGGGFAIRFAGGPHTSLVSGYLLLSPVIPLSPVFKRHSGWATADIKRMIRLSILNTFGISAFNGMPTIWFNKPQDLRDGTETLVYSYRLNTSMHPHFKYQHDVAALGDNVLVLIGSEDQQNFADAYAPLTKRFDPKARVVVLPGVDHLGIMNNPAMVDAAGKWLSDLY